MFGKFLRRKGNSSNNKDDDSKVNSTKDDESTARSLVHGEGSGRKINKENSKRKIKKAGSSRKVKNSDSTQEIKNDTSNEFAIVDASGKGSVASADQELALMAKALDESEQKEDSNPESSHQPLRREGSRRKLKKGNSKRKIKKAGSSRKIKNSGSSHEVSNDTSSEFAIAPVVDEISKDSVASSDQELAIAPKEMDASEQAPESSHPPLRREGSRRKMKKGNSKRKIKKAGSTRKIKNSDSAQEVNNDASGEFAIVPVVDEISKDSVASSDQELAIVPKETDESEQNDEANPESSKPARAPMSRWKSGLEFEQKSVSRRQSTTTSRYKRRNSFDPKRKGTFQQRVKVSDAPHLMSVVNAKPEIKRKATEAVVERTEKMEEKKRKMKARITVNKPSPKQASRTWTSALSKKPVASNKLKGKKPSGYKPPPGSFRADWKSAYEDIVSPTSGKPKMVAKQDLQNESKILSPKKKMQRKVPPLLSIDLDINEEADLPLERQRCQEEKADLAEEDAPHPVPRPVTPPPGAEGMHIVEGIEKVNSEEVNQDDLDEYMDMNSEESSSYEVATAGKNSSHTLREEALEASEEEDEANKAKVKQQLILEFALPAEDGEDQDEEGGLQVPVDLQSFDDLSSVGSWPSIMSGDSYDTKMNKMMQRWIDLHGGNQEDDRTLYDNDVDLEDNVLDHIVLATPNLEDAMVKFEEMTGIRPTPVGPLQGLGAKTAHVGLDNNRYLEILAPDPDNPGPLGEELERLEKGTLIPYHYSIRSSEVSRLIEGYVYDVLGWDPDHIAMVQALPDNSIRQWDLLTMYGHDVGGVAPCYVKWKDPAQHPTATIALKATLTKCTVRAPEYHDVHKLITGVGGISVAHGEPLLECTFSTPKGSLTFSSANPRGLVFPGYDDDQPLSPVPDLMSASESESATVDKDL